MAAAATADLSFVMLLMDMNIQSFRLAAIRRGMLEGYVADRHAGETMHLRRCGRGRQITGRAAKVDLMAKRNPTGARGTYAWRGRHFWLGARQLPVDQVSFFFAKVDRAWGLAV